MDIASTLTLSRAVLSLQQASQNSGNLSSVISQLATTVTMAGDLNALNLPAAAVRSLTLIREGNVIAADHCLPALALLAARVGQAEKSAASGKGPAGDAVSPLDAIRDLMKPFSFPKQNKKDGFWARMADPTDGFSPFRTADDTLVAFFSSPDQLGVWGQGIKGHWENGVGLVAFFNEKAGACGMIFVHGVGRAPWSRVDGARWYSSGGSMAFPATRFSFPEALIRVVDKGVAMTLKWRSVDDALSRVRHKTLTGLGGSKGILLHGKNGTGLEKGLRVYGGVLAALGLTLTGSDEGIGPESADILAGLAPNNIVGSSKSHYRGYGPIGHTKDGVLAGLHATHRTLLGGKPSPVLLLGYGGIGSLIHQELAGNRMLPFSGVIDVDAARLLALRKQHEHLALFQDKAALAPSTLDATSLRWNKIESLPGLAKIIAKAKGTKLFSPNGGPHPIDFDAAAALIAGGVRAVIGSANNQADVDASGSPDAIEWILQAGGVFHAADFVVNRSGAAAVIANAIVLGFNQLQMTEKVVGENVEEEIEHAFRKGIPPFIYERDRAARAWNQRLLAGEAKGGKFDSVG